MECPNRIMLRTASREDEVCTVSNQGRVSDQVESRNIKSGFKDLEVIRFSSWLTPLSNEDHHRAFPTDGVGSSGCSHPPADYRKALGLLKL
jgi:hypothetical protein